MTTDEPPEHISWRGMIERCENPNHVGFSYYGGRGIKVCFRWRYSYASFLADMGLKPAPNYTIDRIDANGDYGPDNCRWATPADQRTNQRPYDESGRVRKAWESRSRTSKARVDLSGQRFSRLVVVRFAETRERRAHWLCRCDCGAETVVSGKSLRRANTRSCGCLSREGSSARAAARNLVDNPSGYRWGHK